MIDFRYHVVSLISVFLALAVGIALGAGPLEETIGDTLTGQVEALREDRDALGAELDAAQSALDRRTVFLQGAAPMLLAGTLPDRRVAVVSLGDVDEEARQDVEDDLAAAGATVSARVQVTDEWTDADVEAYRETLADDVAQYLDPVPGEDASPEVGLAEALIQALTSADPMAPDALSTNAGLVLDMLATGQSELITLTEPVRAPADAVVVLAADGEPVVAADGTAAEPTAATVEGAAEALAGPLAIVTAAQERSGGAILAGGAPAPGDLVSTVLADSELASRISTVTGFRGLTGQLSIPLGLNARLGGVVGHYGYGDGLIPVPDPVDLPPVERAPAGAAPVDTTVGS